MVAERMKIVILIIYLIYRSIAQDINLIMSFHFINGLVFFRSFKNMNFQSIIYILLVFCLLSYSSELYCEYIYRLFYYQFKSTFHSEEHIINSIYLINTGLYSIPFSCI